MALASKAAGKDVGMGFELGVAVSALKSLVDTFQSCAMSMWVAADAMLYQTEVYAASYSPEALMRAQLGTSKCGEAHCQTVYEEECGSQARDSRVGRPSCTPTWYPARSRWVNHIYYDTIKARYAFL
ncbi:hypothetical protein K438DRAFT_872359 [Mycena galopus ATCC 62051]|nr:hypothetical protein K438DRAFT_872359 [Mycena galopus ATCC 62051]